MTSQDPAGGGPGAADVPTVELPAGALRRLAAAFQRGLKLRVEDGTTVSGFLVEVLGLEADYVRARISTVFLDGSVVDDLETARLRQGSVLALSAAMPGLVGATLRKGGYYAAMRAAITLEASGPAAAGGSTVEVSVKLFNLLIDELGPALLAHGVALPPEEALTALGAPAAGGLAGAGAGAGEVWLRALAR